MLISNATRQSELKFSWVYLFNLLFYLLPVFFVDYSSLQLLAIGVVLVLFLPCYFWAFRAPQHKVWLPALCIWILASLITPINYGSVALFAYTAFFTGFAFRFRVALPLCALQILWILLLARTLSVDAIEFFYFSGILLPGIFAIGVAERHRQSAQRRDEKSAHEIKNLGQQLERERIARDLHDLLGHSLSSIALKAELAEKLLSKGDTTAARNELQELIAVSQQSLNQVRHSVTGYRHQGLKNELEQLSQQLKTQGFNVTVQGPIPDFNPLAETALVMILIELTTNILRHSKGDQVRFEFCEDTQGHKIIICDNGSSIEFTPGNGLQGVQERIELLQGKLHINHGDAICITLQLPLTSTTKEHDA
ncbi:sensor histidine kinase [Aliidiomarina minuta]|uniref:Sensor histidine kinase n=1 Tax=Aliidiomarina minuta TaxID=880057 RepID=A0A432W3L9_9GAMM|nr:histidine kinase [Aliidiomarina minuta]RUO23859.1 sensor histidine kinase [Aliidiomarina minuta]